MKNVPKYFIEFNKYFVKIEDIICFSWSESKDHFFESEKRFFIDLSLNNNTIDKLQETFSSEENRAKRQEQLMQNYNKTLENKALLLNSPNLSKDNDLKSRQIKNLKSMLDSDYKAINKLDERIFNNNNKIVELQTSLTKVLNRIN